MFQAQSFQVQNQPDETTVQLHLENDQRKKHRRVGGRIEPVRKGSIMSSVVRQLLEEDCGNFQSIGRRHEKNIGGRDSNLCGQRHYHFSSLGSVVCCFHSQGQNVFSVAKQKLEMNSANSSFEALNSSLYNSGGDVEM